MIDDVRSSETVNFPKYEEGPVSGAYVILDQLSGKFYVGSSWHIAARRYKHEHLFRHGKHPNKELQRCYDEGDIIFVAIPTPDRESAFDEEQLIVNLNWGGDQLLNRSKDVRVSFRGQHHSEETKRLLSIRNTGQFVSEERREKARQFQTGRKYSQSTKDKIRALKLGKARPTHVRQLLNSHNENKSLQVSAEGEIFPSAAACGRAFKVDTKTVHNRIASKSDRFASWFLINKE